MDSDLDLDSNMSMGWVGFQICEILWVWIQYCPWVGSNFKSVKSYGFGFGVGFTLGHRLDWIIVAIALKGPSGPRHGPLSKKCTFWISPNPKLLKDPEKQIFDNTLHFY